MTLWAQVAADGTLLSASGFTSTTHPNLGRYTVLTDIDLSDCALIGTINSPTETANRITIKVANTDAGVLVQTASSASGYVNVPFSVAAFCS